MSEITDVVTNLEGWLSDWHGIEADCVGTLRLTRIEQKEVLRRAVREIQMLRATLKEVSGCHVKHNTPILCEGCQISIAKALGGETRQKWVIHLLGPDDIIDQPDELTALREANMINIGIAKMRTQEPSDNDPHCWAVVKDAELV